ncbi:MAG: ABC transporter ATP-binding protein [Gemmatimonadales bacterium]|nr:MAG: ABC transporter ATP-binding protein [Gemmatimonadales bacterium]
MISVSNLAKSYGDHILFQGATFQLNPGERYGLVGANGSGKTTLLSILTGDIEASEGTVSIPKRARLGVLRQDQFLHDEASIVSVAMMGNRELYDAMIEKEALLADTAAGGDFDADRFGELEETVQRLDGYTAEARAGAILEGLGIPAEKHQQPMRTLSGGFKLRVLLAQVLAGAPDVLLLDEPTNHLDILSIRWLETFLAEFSGPVVVISHDIRFLDNVATHILDVDYQTVQLYHGNYSEFQVAKHEERGRREKDIAGREKEIAEMQRFVDRFKAKASKARQAQSKAKVIEKRASEMTELAPSSRRWPTFRFEPKRDSGKEVLKVDGVKKAFGENQVLHGVNLTVERGDRLAIMGPNGIGKSTLLKIAMGRLEPDAGEVTWGYETHPGYFAQDYKDQFENRNGTAESWIWEACPDRDRGYVRGRMGLVLFSGDDGLKRLDALSGGEAARLVFARIALDRPNVLVLDEPTNHLDLESIEALVEGLQSFAGTIIFVSHDRWFVGELATRIVEISPGGIRDYRGTYDEYVDWCGDDHLDAAQVVLKAKREKKAARSESRSESKGGDRAGGGGGDAKASAQATGSGGARRPAGGTGNPKVLERRRDELTGRIESGEARVAEIDALFLEPGYFDRTAPQVVKRLQDERARLVDRELPKLMNDWEEVELALAEVKG